MTIVEFLEARLAADERMCTLTPGGTYRVHSLDGGTEADEEAVQQYYHRFQPEWMARDLAAKRAIIADYRKIADSPASIDPFVSRVGEGWMDAFERVVKTIATAYADHPDYDQDWAP